MFDQLEPHCYLPPKKGGKCIHAHCPLTAKPQTLQALKFGRSQRGILCGWFPAGSIPPLLMLVLQRRLSDNDCATLTSADE